MNAPTRAPTAAEPAYEGEATACGRRVSIVDEGGRRPLPAGDPDGEQRYAWGRGGPAARELARAILLDATGNPMLAERLCRPLTWEVLRRLPETRFRLTRAEVLAWVAEQG